MKFARQLKEKNIAEYLIYMWQLEDLLRALKGDMEQVHRTLVASYPQEEQAEAGEWYGNLCDMMRMEGVMEKGHLQINRNVVLTLTELHNTLLSSSKFPFYNAAYFKALPFIVELRQKGADKEEPELETCFEALYGVMLLRLQKKEVGRETLTAVEAISNLLSLLANYYDKEKRGELEV